MEQKLYDAAAKLPVTHAQLDISAVPLKQNNGVRRMVLTFAACAAARRAIGTRKGEHDT